MSGIVPNSLELYPEYCVTSLMWTLCRLRWVRGGEWTMANQLYVKSGESPLVTLAGWKAGKQATLSKITKIKKRALLPKVPVFKCQKWHFECPNLQTDPKNLAKHPPKWWGRVVVDAFPFSGEYQANF